MNTYQKFASVYDAFMEDVPYDEWCSCLAVKLRQAGIADGIVCELGCGTGNVTTRLAEAGYDMIGIDASEDMLSVAQKKELLRRHPDLAEKIAQEAEIRQTVKHPDILYLQQDMRSFELYGTVRAVVSVCDSLNYVLEENDLLQVFRLVNNYLDPGGIFLFDVNTPARYEAIGESTIAENRPEGSFIWENYYDPEDRLNQYDLTLFIPEGNGLYRKHEETHFERAYSEETIRRLLAEAGLVCDSVEAAYTGGPATKDTERILVAAHEVQKKKGTN